MKIHEFLDHYGVTRNPFAEEDAQTDPVFKEHCITSTFHPAWDKVFGDPREPSTAIVFGEKGSGKTAMQLQIAGHLARFNQQNPHHRTFIIQYTDFNHFLDRFRDRLRGRARRNVERALSQWKLWDHMDAVLTLGVTELIDEILGLDTGRPGGPNPVRPEDLQSFDRSDARDLLLLAACYDQSTAGTFKGRWRRAREAVKFQTLLAHADLALAGVWSALVIAAAVAVYGTGQVESPHWIWLFVALGLAGWLPWLWRLAKCFRLARGVVRNVRISNRESGPLRHVLMQFRSSELEGQPLPNRKRTDDRYELLLKLQRLLNKLGFTGVIVLIDRLDEPHLINGSPELMKSLLWPMLDNKFLKHPGLGLKLMVPSELMAFVQREEREFHERARLDKQNLVSSFEWTGEALYDVANARLQACTDPGQQVTLADLFDESIGQQRLIETFGSLRVPRRLFKFLYRLLVAHSSAHTSQQPSWKISPELFESTLAVFQREQQAYDRGVGAG